ncbi:MAG: Lrp/AsnC family transcriptional regulator [Desulfurococcales archaeon]|nr:Lrp/AsnC family transcriptional regulator [Desulfurococcales archaeon]
MARRLDDRDYRILRILRRDSRTPYTVIARELGISEVAARKRVLRLIRDGVIRRFTIDYSAPGEFKAIILVKTLPQTRVPEVSKRLVMIDGVEAVYEVTGEYDIIVIASARSVDEINDYVDKIRSTSGVASTNTLIILRTWTP